MSHLGHILSNQRQLKRTTDGDLGAPLLPQAMGSGSEAPSLLAIFSAKIVILALFKSCFARF